jgi:chromate reductase
MGTRVIALAGSLRRGSYNRRLLEAAVALSPTGMAIEVYEGLAEIPLFDDDAEAATAGGPEPVRRLRAAIAVADGVLIATPEYNQSFPGVLKNAIDWVSRPGPVEVLAQKPVAVIGATAGRWGTRLAQAGLRQVLAATEARVMPQPALYLADAARAFDAAGRLIDAVASRSLRDVLGAFAVWMGLLAPARPDQEPNAGTGPPAESLRCRIQT